MKKGQMTLFVILGLVFIISIVILVLMRQSLIVPQATEITADDALAQSCLVRATEVSLLALTDDGVIMDDEGGPLSDQVFYVATGDFPFGVNNYVGLCSATGPNAIGLFGRRYSCNSQTYHYRSSPPAVQEQLTRAITNHMRNCLSRDLDVDFDTITGQAEVTIQNQGIVVRWSDPEIQHSPRIPIQTVWRAIRETVEKEVSNPEYSPNRIEDGAYPDRELACQSCQNVVFQDVTSDKSLENPYNVWEYSVDGDVIARILLENRPVMILDVTDGYVRANARPLSCSGTPCTLILYTFDDDEITIVSDAPQVTISDKNMEEPHTNRLIIAPSCVTDLDVTIADEAAEEMILQLRNMPQAADCGVAP